MNPGYAMTRAEYDAYVATHNRPPGSPYMRQVAPINPNDVPVTNDRADTLEAMITERTRRATVRQIITTSEPRPPAACGTHAGYNGHKRRGEPTCADCKQAHAVYHALRYNARKTTTAADTPVRPVAPRKPSKRTNTAPNQQETEVPE